MRICVAGAYGAFGIKHLDALAAIEGVTVTSVMGPTRSRIAALAAERGIPHAATTLDECLARDDVDAVILATPTQVHAEQAIACISATATSDNRPQAFRTARATYCLTPHVA